MTRTVLELVQSRRARNDWKRGVALSIAALALGVLAAAVFAQTADGQVVTVKPGDTARVIGGKLPPDTVTIVRPDTVKVCYNASLAVIPCPTPGVPGAVTNLVASASGQSSVALTFTQVHNGMNAPASYDIRFAPPPLAWGTAAPVSSGSCASPLSGTAINAPRTCEVTGLTAATAYQFQLVAFRGTLGQGAVFGALSNIATATTMTGPPLPPDSGAAPEPGPGDVELWKDDFNRATKEAMGQPYSKNPGIDYAVTTGRTGNAVRFIYSAKSADNIFEKGWQTATDIYFRYWFRTSVGADPTCGGRGQSGFKWFMAWRPGGAPRYTMGVSNLYQPHLGFSSHDNSSQRQPNPFPPNFNKQLTFGSTADGQWHKYTLHIRTGAGGYEQIWIDGVKVLDNQGMGYDHSSVGIAFFKFPGNVVDWYPGCDFTVDADDLVVWRKP